MTIIRNGTGTAFVAAEFRAEENRELHPLYRDPIVPLFLDEKARRAAERIFASFPAIKNMVRIRTAISMTDSTTTSTWLSTNCNTWGRTGYSRQRKPAQSVAYFEIDDENILAFKEW